MTFYTFDAISHIIKFIQRKLESIAVVFKTGQLGTPQTLIWPFLILLPHWLNVWPLAWPATAVHNHPSGSDAGWSTGGRQPWLTGSHWVRTPLQVCSDLRPARTLLRCGGGHVSQSIFSGPNLHTPATMADFCDNRKFNQDRSCQKMKVKCRCNNKNHLRGKRRKIEKIQ